MERRRKLQLRSMDGVQQLEALGSLQKSREVQATGSLWGVGGKRNLSPAKPDSLKRARNS